MSKISHLTLTVAGSDLINEWDHKKNTLFPENLSVGSKKEAWWLCKVGHSWQAKICRKTKCPYCANRLPCDDNCLSFTHAELAAEWHPTKNGILTAKDFTIRSGQVIEWLCSKNKGHKSWKAKINARVRGAGCPTCAGKIADSTNCLATINPELVAEWHPTKNGSLTPERVLAGSSKKVWWLCSFGHFWEARIYNRAINKSGCHYCANKKVDQNNCLSKTHPDLAKEWHPTKNKTAKYSTPDQVTAGSDHIVWWQCQKNKIHAWQAKINHRKYNNDRCPDCKKEELGKNNLVTTHPELAAEWHPTRNGAYAPNDYTYGSNIKIWWLCPIGHGWRSAINARTRIGSNTKCTKCFSQSSAGENRVASELKLIFLCLEQRKKIAEKEADIYIEQLKLVVEFDGAYFHKNSYERDQDKNIFFEKNGLNVIRLRGAKLKHISKNDITVDCANIKIDSIKSLLVKIQSLYDTALNYDQKTKIEEYFRIVKFWNNEDYKKSLKLLPGKLNGTSFEDEYLKLNNIKWHHKNKFFPEHYTIKSGKEVWWQCKKNESHEWVARIASISNGQGCPYCANKKVHKSNCLANTNPKLAAEWHPTKNGSLTPEQVVAGSKQKVWWQCLIIKSHSYEAEVDSRNRINRACPYCLNRKIDKNNCLSKTHPDLAKEWHPTKNDSLTPEQVVAGSKKEVWWQCKKNESHEWDARVEWRTKKGNACPICSNRRVHKSNCLSTTHPELAAEWHPTRNGAYTPNDYTYGSKKKAWWQCPKHLEYSYHSTILSRSSGHGCPECARKIKSITAHKRWERVAKNALLLYSK